MNDYTEVLIPIIHLAGTALLAVLTWLGKIAVSYLSSRNKLAKQIMESEQAARIRTEVADIAETVVRYTEQVYADQIKRAREDGKLTPGEAKQAAGIAMAAAIQMLQERGIQVGKDTLNYAIEAALQKLNQKKTVTAS